MTHDEAMKHFEKIAIGARDSWSDSEEDGLLSKEEFKTYKFDAQVQTDKLS
jgi:hypothetical protein